MSRRNYQRHTADCGGIDPVAIEIIVNAGTVEALRPDHLICDCERAYIITHVPSGYAMLKINNSTRKRLENLWHTIETSEDDDALIPNDY